MERGAYVFCDSCDKQICLFISETNRFYDEKSIAFVMQMEQEIITLQYIEKERII